MEQVGRTKSSAELVSSASEHVADLQFKRQVLGARTSSGDKAAEAELKKKDDELAATLAAIKHAQAVVRQAMRPV